MTPFYCDGLLCGLTWCIGSMPDKQGIVMSIVWCLPLPLIFLLTISQVSHCCCLKNNLTMPVLLLKTIPYFYTNEPVWRIGHTETRIDFYMAGMCNQPVQLQGTDCTRGSPGSQATTSPEGRWNDMTAGWSSCRFLNWWRGFLFIKSLFRADRGSLGALPVTVIILAIQSLSCYRFRPQDYVPDSFVQIKCFGLGCEINLQIPNSPADL